MRLFSAARTEGLTISQISTAWVVGSAVMIVAGAIFRSKPLFGVGIMLALALALSWLWSGWSLRGLNIKRRFGQTRAFYGEDVDMAYTITNRKPLPVPWLELEDQVPGSLVIKSAEASEGYAGPARIRLLNTALSLGWYERVTRHYTLNCAARGEHTFGPIEVQSGDVFGLFRRVGRVETPQTLLIYPRYVPVERLGITARQPFGDFKAIQNLATDPLRLRAVREYAYGDNPRHVHWKATARRGEVQIKLFEPAATPQLYVFCNQDTFERMWEGIDTQTLELTITVAASLVNHALNEGYMVGLQVNSFAASSDRQVKIAPSRDPGQFTRILETLARISGWSGLPMEDLIRAERRALPRSSTMVVVTGIVTDDMLDVLVALRRAGHPVTLVETAAGNKTASARPSYVPGDALRAQGINYFAVEAPGAAAELETVSLAAR